jgi:hypothetical protein
MKKEKYNWSNPLALSLPSISLLIQKKSLRKHKDITGGRFECGHVLRIVSILMLLFLWSF